MRTRASSTAAQHVDAQIVFQPIIDLSCWRVIGVEALARFADGSPAPVHLDRASETGGREALEIELIRLAIAASVDLPERLLITLNASGATIILPEIGDLLRHYRRPWGLELFEGPTSVGLQEIRQRVTDLGGQLLVDDAGVASADALRITALRPDIVKIDRALFWHVASDGAARDRLQVLLTGARQAGARVLVEGVSDAAQVDLARSLQADLAQGFHLGMPTAAAQMGTMLTELHRRIGVDAPGL